MPSPTATLPQHVAIIMDGNGRWAQARQLPRLAGHEAGVEAIEKIIKSAIEHKIKILTLFAFGIENWQRPASEVKFLMALFVKNLQTQIPHFLENQIQLRVIGDRTGIDAASRKEIQRVESLTAENKRLILVIAFNYSGRWDIVQATQKLCLAVQMGQLNPEQISYPQLQDAMCLADLPEPDLFIRTSGEQRLSNFLLWQLAYTELYFTHTFWPDFDDAAFQEALQAFAARQRRYGLTGQQLAEQTLPNGEPIDKSL
jgi:undecaprenyl diphosphate synthase